MALAQALMMGYRPLTTYDFDNKAYVRGPVGTSGTPPSSESPVGWSSDGLTLFSRDVTNSNTRATLRHNYLNAAYDVTDFTGSTALSPTAARFVHSTNNPNVGIVISSDGFYAVGVRATTSTTASYEIVETDAAFDFTSNSTLTKTTIASLPQDISTNLRVRSIGLSVDDTKLYVAGSDAASSGNLRVHEFTINFSTKTVTSEDAVVTTSVADPETRAPMGVAPNHVLIQLSGANGYVKLPRASGSISGQSVSSAITNDDHGTTHNEGVFYNGDGSSLWFYETTQDQWYEYDTSN